MDKVKEVSSEFGETSAINQSLRLLGRQSSRIVPKTRSQTDRDTRTGKRAIVQIQKSGKPMVVGKHLSKRTRIVGCRKVTGETRNGRKWERERRGLIIQRGDALVLL